MRGFGAAKALFDNRAVMIAASKKAMKNPKAVKSATRAGSILHAATKSRTRMALTGAGMGAAYGAYSILPGPQRANGRSSGANGPRPRSMGGYA